MNNETIKSSPYNVGDRITQSPMWKYDSANGTIIKITKDGYYVIRWDDINGEWYYTEDQIKDVLILEENKDE